MLFLSLLHKDNCMNEKEIMIAIMFGYDEQKAEFTINVNKTEFISSEVSCFDHLIKELLSDTIYIVSGDEFDVKEFYDTVNFYNSKGNLTIEVHFMAIKDKNDEYRSMSSWAEVDKDFKNIKNCKFSA